MLNYIIMTRGGGLLHYTTLSATFLALFVANVLVFRSPIVGALLLIFFLWFYGRQLGSRAALLAIFVLLGAVGYYLDLLHQTIIVAIILLTPLAILIQRRKWLEAEMPSALTFARPSLALLLSAVSFLLFLAGAVFLLIQHPIIDAVRSPWHVIPSIFFGLVFVLSALTVSYARRAQITLLFLLTIGLALLAYPLGYGFDGFIHRAAEEHIFEYGSISPKPLYYAGQYGLTLIAAHGFFTPVDLIDRLLAPLLALFIPILAFRRFGKGALALWLLPLGSFITTTPQALANIWTLLVLLSFDQKTNWRLPLLFTAAAIATHPLSGIPALIYLSWMWLSSHAGAKQRLVKTLFIVASAVILPLIFIVNAALTHLPIGVTLREIGSTNWAELLGLQISFANHFQPFLDAAYLFGWNRIALVIAIVVVSLLYLRRKKDLPSIVPAVILLVNYLILAVVVRFDFLIDYERANYAERIFELAQFFLLPTLALAVKTFFAHLIGKPMAVRLGATTLAAMMITSAVYLTYPRHDNYDLSRGFNVSVSDYATVSYIHDQHASINYVVLANQAVSAAAIDSYGFAKYYNGDVFYYPIPTGGALYQIYLEMVNDTPSRVKALEAMDLAGVDQAYFVVNDYWFLSDKIIENAKREADSWIAIDAGATYVFTYER